MKQRGNERIQFFECCDFLKQTTPTVTYQEARKTREDWEGFPTIFWKKNDILKITTVQLN